MGSFERSFEKVEELKKEPLFLKRLLEDIEKGIVFPAVRKQEMHFYLNGACLFEFSDSSFKCHRKFAGLEGKSSRVTENTIKKELGNPDFSFVSNYEQIKDLCGKHFESSEGEQLERACVSRLYSTTFNKFVDDASKKIIVIDIEVRYNQGDRKKCDLMLYNRAIKKLMLVEVKISTDSRLVSNGEPEIFEQMASYTKWINEDNSFIDQYLNHMKLINKLLDIDISPEVNNICRTAKLLVIDKEDNFKLQHKVRLIERLKQENILFCRGDISADEVWDGLYN